MTYKTSQYERQERLIREGKCFAHDQGGGRFRGKSRSFVLQTATNNLYPAIQQLAKTYFSQNGIEWWGGEGPTGHTLSSQISCLNHLMPLMQDPRAVLSLINGIRNDFFEVLPINSDANPAYIAFEVVGAANHLNEGNNSRGQNCTSIDALILAKHKDGRRILLPIEWKYTESYNNSDKSTEKGKGEVRQRRYNDLITASTQLKSKATYAGSIYYREPFYQLMRQTLWAEQILLHKDTETDLQSDDFLHIHIIPRQNRTLLDKCYLPQKDMEATWRDCLTDQSKYLRIDPSDLFEPLKSSEKYRDLIAYLQERYW